jgi:hypothetical protein
MSEANPEGTRAWIARVNPLAPTKFFKTRTIQISSISSNPLKREELNRLEVEANHPGFPHFVR